MYVFAVGCTLHVGVRKSRWVLRPQSTHGIGTYAAGHMCPKSLLSNAACRILISDYRPEANQTHRVQWLSDLKLSLTAARRS